MALKTFTRHLYQCKYDFQDTPEWKLMDRKFSEPDTDWMYIGPREVEVEVPDEFLDMRGYQVEQLRKKEQDVRAEFSKRITEIQAQIQSLLAIENTVEEA